ncbi:MULTISPECIES: aldo/keto reductase [Micromonospora]|uniref:Aryl-alcohol dehydrogenase (NADP(+)) n=2 Tax=Micromonospora TaxID=1873 RepID=A0A1C5ADW6_9ACTN|nr:MULTISPECIES: aldo/keto reductase [Micromonospora]RAO00633.1 Aryl-alcohol dehydrogenase (NADP(+)) [Micromonospora saelicesensis]RAO22761.1 Aryl-alcohol dehydrogenase (NADP(+)) [Micromonospora noduli]RAO50755.1 Aryl-alcohol dehydrogenase (NADP(+)) [Micromonospora saelicesensis]RAO51279.1 Aryl-alcohol dehydrogenase (NADP(+)) [Micromonospora saelicesensis]SCF43425.1 Predicted oxidoreductase [Micromonospora saelicesensis]
MQYRTLGRTGVQVSTLVLGAMNFGKLGHTTQDEATAIVDAALEAGINLIDTADMYSQGESEQLVGKAIAGRRDDIVLATKAGMPMGDERNQRGSSRRWLVTELDNSLRRLGVDHVDLYQIHRWDPTTSDEETLSALTDLQRAGKIRYFGSSTFPAYRIVQAEWAAREHHLGRYVTEQPSYSILQRGIEAHVLPVTEQYGLGVLAWSPLASGWLSGAIRAGREITTSRSALLPARFDLSVPANQARLDAVEQLATVADEAGLTLIQLALGFVTAHPAVTSAIIGPRTIDHLHAQLAAADTVLPADVLDAIDAIVAPGVDLAAAEKFDTPPALLDPARRRR